MSLSGLTAQGNDIQIHWIFMSGNNDQLLIAYTNEIKGTSH